MVSKSRYRDTFKTYRASLQDQQYLDLSSAIVYQLGHLAELMSAASILAYWPIVSKREINILPLLQTLRKNGTMILLPVITDPQNGIMEPGFWDTDSVPADSVWGIPQPAVSHIRPEEPDIVLAPALGADLRGFRLGYGKGFYDRFLERHPIPVVTAVFDATLVDELPSEPYDIPAHFVVSERGILHVADKTWVTY